MSRRYDVQSAEGPCAVLHDYRGYGFVGVVSKTAPTNGQQGWSPGCLWQNVTGAIGSFLYMNIGTFASSLWVALDGNLGLNLVDITSTRTLSAQNNAGRTNLLDLAGGFTLTLPAATGTGLSYKFVVKTVSTTGYVLTAAGSDVFKGSLELDLSASVGSTERFVSTTNQNITLNGTTTGGVAIGDWYTVQDIAAGVWTVTGLLVGSGTLATPFS